VIIRLLAVVTAALLVTACGTPTLSTGAGPAADAVSPTTSAAPAVAAPRPVAQVAAKRTTSKRTTPRPAAPKPAIPKPATPKPATQKPAPASAGGCNVNYTPCVPNDPVDVDCQGGKGNGPSYVKGPVTVIGTDVYGLDADHDGIACE
jgi:hypothetical protein